MMSKFARIALLLIVSLGSTASAEQVPLSDEMGKAILDELRAIRQLLEKQQQPAAAQRPARPAAPRAMERVEFTMSERPMLGAEDAPMILVEFTDYECPFCQRFHTGAYEEIKKEYIDTGKLRFASVDLPLKFHKNARQAAHAAHCAGDQGSFWELRHVLIENARTLSPEAIDGFAADLELDQQVFRKCMADQPYAEQIDADVALSGRVGITGTPSFVLAPYDGQDSIKGMKLVGAQPYSAFKSLLDKQLEKLGKPAG